MGRTVVLAVSDFHMGIGLYPAAAAANVHEDFHHDAEFARFLSHEDAAAAGAALRLVCNGDFFDLLLNGGTRRQSRLTARMALELVRRGLAGHPEVFRALREFNARPGRSVHFVAGNHDPDLLLPAVQELLRERIGGTVRYHTTHFEEGDLLVEHGHLYDVVNGIDPDRLWTRDRRGELVFAPPVGGILVRGVIAPLKPHRPLVHKIKPVGRYARWVLAHDPALCSRMSWAFVRTLFRHLLGRERRLADRFRHLARRNVRRILRLDRFHLIESVARTLLRLGGYATVVFGHTHRARDVVVEAGKRYLNTGTWAEVLRLDGRAIVPATQLSYARVVLEDGRCVDAGLAAWA